VYWIQETRCWSKSKECSFGKHKFRKFAAVVNPRRTILEQTSFNHSFLSTAHDKWSLKVFESLNAPILVAWAELQVCTVHRAWRHVQNCRSVRCTEPGGMCRITGLYGASSLAACAELWVCAVHRAWRHVQNYRSVRCTEPGGMCRIIGLCGAPNLAACAELQVCTLHRAWRHVQNYRSVQCTEPGGMCRIIGL
jgi:hypothetical protein